MSDHRVALQSIAVLGLLLRSPLLAAYRMVPDRSAIDRDIARQLQPRLDLPQVEVIGVHEVDRAMKHRSFRSLFYYRLRQGGLLGRLAARSLATVYAPEHPLYLSCPDIGPGLYVSHGFSTILNARTVGRDCLLAQQVTVGYSNKGGPPTIGDRVQILAGATVIGAVTIGDDAVVGAHALVIRDVPPNAIVGGVPATVLGYGYVPDKSQ